MARRELTRRVVHRRWTAQAEDAVGGEQADQQGLPAQGLVRPTPALRTRTLSTPPLPELAGEPELAAAKPYEKFAKKLGRHWNGIRRIAGRGTRPPSALLCRGTKLPDSRQSAPSTGLPDEHVDSTHFPGAPSVTFSANTDCSLKSDTGGETA